MSWTKRQLVSQAYDEIGLADYVFDLEPEQLQSACRRMDAMIAGWNASGVRIAYPLSDSPDTTDIDEDTNMPDFCNEAVYLNLAVRLGASMGKNLSPDTRINARKAYTQLLNGLMDAPIEYTYPSSMPVGQGKKPWRTNNNPYFTPSDTAIDAGPDGEIEFQ